MGTHTTLLRWAQGGVKGRLPCRWATARERRCDGALRSHHLASAHAPPAVVHGMVGLNRRYQSTVSRALPMYYVSPLQNQGPQPVSQPASQLNACVRACSVPSSLTQQRRQVTATHSTHVVARWHDLSRPGIISVCGQPCPHTPTRRKSGTAQTLMSAPAHTVIERHGAFHATSRAFLWRALGVEEREGGVGEILV